MPLSSEPPPLPQIEQGGSVVGLRRGVSRAVAEPVKNGGEGSAFELRISQVRARAVHAGAAADMQFRHRERWAYSAGEA